MPNIKDSIEYILSSSTKKEAEGFVALGKIRRFLIENEYRDINVDESKVETADKSLLIYENASAVPGYLDDRVAGPRNKLSSYNNGYMVMFIENKVKGMSRFYPVFSESERIEYLDDFFYDFED